MTNIRMFPLILIVNCLVWLPVAMGFYRAQHLAAVEPPMPPTTTPVVEDVRQKQEKMEADVKKIAEKIDTLQSNLDKRVNSPEYIGQAQDKAARNKLNRAISDRVQLPIQQ